MYRRTVFAEWRRGIADDERINREGHFSVVKSRLRATLGHAALRAAALRHFSSIAAKIRGRDYVFASSYHSSIRQ
eukprot:3997158-Pleurochrysis_carterae.AAC.9